MVVDARFGCSRYVWENTSVWYTVVYNILYYYTSQSGKFLVKIFERGSGWGCPVIQPNPGAVKGLATRVGSKTVGAPSTSWAVCEANKRVIRSPDISKLVGRDRNKGVSGAVTPRCPAPSLRWLALILHCQQLTDLELDYRSGIPLPRALLSPCDRVLATSYKVASGPNRLFSPP